MKYSIKEIAAILHISADCLNEPKAIVSALLTDSRSLTYPGESLFFAIKTKNNDGHHYIAELYKKGVKNFVVESVAGIPPEFNDANFLKVDSSGVALQAIAAYHRKRFTCPVIGITGSKGKTTLKERLNQLLKEDYSIVRSPRSFNSQIGVPLSLWEIDDNTSLGIIEAGISQPNEMNLLQDMIRPTIGVWTNIGDEHSDGFLSIYQKAKEKAKLLTNCDTIIYCADDKLISETVKPILKVAQGIGWSQHDTNAELYISQIDKNEKTTDIIYRYGYNTSRITVPLTRDRDIENVMNCLAVMLCLGIDTDTIGERMARLTPIDTRLNVIEGTNNCMVIADSYTSDYNSLAPALDFMARRRTQGSGMTVILSDVQHEAFTTAELYRLIAELMKNKNITRFIGIGEEIEANQRYFGINSQFFQSTEEFLQEVSQSDFEDEIILVKGAPEFEFKRIIDMLEARQHQTVLQVNLDAVASNYNFFRSKLRPDTKIVCMVKASGYGAGSDELAKTLQDRGAAYLAVAAHDEGADLRKAGITMPIMVLNPKVTNYKAMFAYSLEPEVFSLEECKEIIKEAEKCGITDYPVHIKIETGMNRLGFLKEQLPELVNLLQSQDAIKPASVFSHLSVADEPLQDEYTMKQFTYFEECCNILQSGFKHHILRHILNTTGIIRFPEYQYDMVRVGIGLNGIATVNDGSEDELEPISSLHSVIISIKEHPAGTTIGYGRKGVLERKSRIATIPIGYADGFARCFSNGKACMWVNGTLCPTIGNVCMDVCMIDVTEADCKVGDSVEIFGKHIPVEALAEARGTIPYEILTSISSRVKRVYYRE
ncbi:MAG: bifunctional UDP-N-acetylmuramoyl-tripeptide:D-alanyl-D-alanine ligase/alanine racemase [Muribaculaceae bacterium]|nr:bifunctional UDP-N-acetylmuramoyl-tripeptide:D-alanyl-D-alanine ligase/alanine racemase [Muribaculaceae bacterium]MEE1297419.1 bifunctional UDP-N-acetylmuramoyl-tripeptide:D-alanyl-D-alanine ligase/alanine racemase [Muribaculaceae bacterium]